ncbi:MAG: DOMON domain-containing protein [Trueperaceae bacterium]|nr:DOMON domain-containing protein [Trueperaceae bacterium]
MNKLLATLALALLVSLGMAQPTADGTIADGEYASTLAHEESGAVMYWTIDGDMLHFGMTMESSGWIGVGFAMPDDVTRAKSGFDQYMFSVVDGTAMAYDMYQEDARGAPTMDAEAGGSDSLTEFAGTYEGEMWTVEFVRPLDTGEETDAVIVAGEPMLLTFAEATTMDLDRRHERSSRGGAYVIEEFMF